LQRDWERLARKDPLWAILTNPSKKGRRWETEAFFSTGQQEVDDLMKHIDSVHFKVRRKAALDFGCGVGRVSQALANYFESVYGVDIAPTMIELASKFNRHAGKCKFYLNETDDLHVFKDDSFDLVYSNLTLQHIDKKYIMRYLREFLRILARGGLIIFHLPSKPALLKRWFWAIYRRIPYPFHLIRYSGGMEMHWMKKKEVLAIIEINGGRVLEAIETGSANGWQMYRYCVTKD
jgi:ubiquinone/menaquinone biosynthesis C-methylase UbiE